MIPVSDLAEFMRMVGTLAKREQYLKIDKILELTSTEDDNQLTMCIATLRITWHPHIRPHIKAWDPTVVKLYHYFMETTGEARELSGLLALVEDQSFIE